MARKEYKGAAEKLTLGVAITSGALTLSTNETPSAAWPDGATYSFVITVDRGNSNEEKILVSSRSSDTFTIQTRGYDGTSAQSHSENADVEHTIDASTLVDIYDSIDDIIDGTTAFTGALSAPNGSAAAPAFSFSGDTDTGLYTYAANTLAFSTAGTLAARFDGSQNFYPSGSVLPAADGTKDLGSVANTWRYVFGEQFRADDSADSVTAPAYSFSGDTNTGIYNYAADQLGFTVGGAIAGRIQAAGSWIFHGDVKPDTGSTHDLGVSGTTWRFAYVDRVLASTGDTVLTPAYAFDGDSNTGMYNLSADNLAFATGGVIAGKAQGDQSWVFYGDVKPGTASTHNLGLTSNPWNNLYAERTRLADGSASAPAHSFTDDTDTGFYRAATGQINVSNNNDIGFLFGPSINVTYRNLRGDADNTRQLGTSSIAFAKTYSHQYVMGTTGPTINFGTGTPEGVVTAPVGSLFLRTNGGAGTTLYVKESGAGNTGWAAK